MVRFSKAWLTNRTPLAGRLFRASALKLASLSALKGDMETLRFLAEALPHIPDSRDAAAALNILDQVASSGNSGNGSPADDTPAARLARDLICDLAMQGHHQAETLSAEKRYLPADESKRAAFLILTSRLQDYEDLDLTGSLIKKFYWSSGDDLRRRLLAALRTAGRPDLLRSLLVDPVNIEGVSVSGGETRRISRMTNEEWDIAVKALTSQGRWGDLVRLAEAAPVRWGIIILRAIAASNPGSAEREGLSRLIDLAFDVQDTVHDAAHNPGSLNGDCFLAKNVWATRHDNWVWSARFSPDGRLLATGSADATVRVTRVEDSEALWMERHGSSVWGTAFSPDGRLLVTGSGDRTVRLWQVSDGKCLWVGKHADAVLGVAFSADGKFVLSGGWDRTVRVWRVSSGECYWVRNHDDVVWGMGFTPDSKHWVSGGWDRTVRMWKVADGKPAWKAEHEHSVWEVAVSPDGQYLASSSSDRTVRLWATEDGSCLWTGRHEGEVRLVSFSPDGKRLASAGQDGTIKVWRVRDGSCLWSASHDGEVTGLLFTPDSRHVVSSSLDRTARMWRARDGQCVLRSEHDSPILRVSQSPQGEYLATANWDRSVRLLKIKPWQDVPLAEIDSWDIEWLNRSLTDDDSFPSQRTKLEVLKGLWDLRKRWDIEIEDVPERINVGEFDIEIEETTIVEPPRESGL